MTVTIKKCQAEDLQLLRELAIRTFVDTYGPHNTPEVMANYLAQAFNEGQLSSELANLQSEFYVLLAGDQWSGYLKLNEGEAQTEARKDNALEIERIYIDKACQGRGYGKLLLNHALKVARSRQKDRLWLGVWERNPKAISFYKSQGFKKVGTHLFIIGGEAQQDWVMEIEMVSSGG